MSRPRVLVVDDEAPVRYTLRSILEEEDVEVVEAADGVEALEHVDAGGIDLVLSDLRMPRLDGMELLAELGARQGAPRLILITAYGSERVAVEAMKGGALDYFAKPFDADEIARVVRRSLETVRLSDENRALRAELALRRLMVFESAAMKRVAELVERVAPRDVTVLIGGESGTGKELVAEAIVRASSRAHLPYVKFNCAALPRELAEAELFGHSRGAFTGATSPRAGLFRQADGGTLLLDEIGELDLLTQGKLLRVLQDGQVRPVGEDRAVSVNVRLLAASNRDLLADVEAGRFRHDLYYRLDVVQIELPPLRERVEDIAPLARHFADRFAHRYGIGSVRLAADLVAELERQPWPGNVRELEHALERLLALSEVRDGEEDSQETMVLGQDALLAIAPSSSRALPQPAQPLGLRERLAVFERGLIVAELSRCHGNQSEAARQLGVSRPTLIDKMKKHGLR